MTPQINYDDDLLYEHLTLICQEFEQAALKSGTRDGLLVVANSPLQMMDQVLESSSRALTMNRTKKVKSTTGDQRSSSDTGSSSLFSVEQASATESAGFIPSIPAIPSLNFNPDTINAAVDNLVHGETTGDPLVDLSTVEFDPDLAKLTGSTNLQDYLKDCLGCDARLSFDWQLKPVDLLSPIAGLVDDINIALDGFELQMNPYSSLKDLCDMLNNINWLCLPDLVAVLMALKLLLKSYLSFQLSINLDWTVVIGPLLKLILDAIASLIQAIAGVLVGPLDCIIGAFKSIAEVEKELASAAVAAGALANKLTSLPEKEDVGFTLDTLYKEVSVDKGTPGTASATLGLSTPAIASLDVSTRVGNDKSTSPWAFPSGIQLTDKIKLPDAVKDINFPSSHWTTKIILAVQEAKNYILDLVRKILGSLDSLKGLVSGGLSVQLGNLGLLLFVKDMVALILLIIDLVTSNKNIKDWCDYLQKHPEILEEALGKSYDKITVSNSDRALVLAQGPKVVGTIKTCAAETSGPQQQMLSQWIQDLKRGN